MKRLSPWLMTCALLLSTSVAAEAKTSELIDVGGHSLHISCYGEGSPTVVLDSGLGGTHLDWSLVQPTLAQHSRVCSYDRAGYGLSEMGPTPRNAQRLAKELAAILQSPSISTPVLLVGHSLAGFHLRELAQKHTDKVVALVLIESAHEDQFAEFRQRAKLRLAPNKGDRLRMSPPAAPKQLPAPQRALAQTYANEQKSLLTLRSELTNFISSANELKRSDPTIKQPLLVISRGKAQWRKSKDAVLREQIWQELQTRLGDLSPQSTRIIAADSGHFIHLEQPQLVIDAVNGFIDELRSGKDDTLEQLLELHGKACELSDNNTLRCSTVPTTAALKQN